MHYKRGVEAVRWRDSLIFRFIVFPYNYPGLVRHPRIIVYVKICTENWALLTVWICTYIHRCAKRISHRPYHTSRNEPPLNPTLLTESRPRAVLPPNRQLFFLIHPKPTHPPPNPRYIFHPPKVSLFSLSSLPFSFHPHPPNFLSSLIPCFTTEYALRGRLPFLNPCVSISLSLSLLLRLPSLPP